MHRRGPLWGLAAVAAAEALVLANLDSLRSIAVAVLAVQAARRDHGHRRAAPLNLFAHSPIPANRHRLAA